MNLIPHFVDEYRRYKKLAELAIAQVSDEELTRASGDENNSIAIYMRHIAGNLRSRFSDFLASDGEKEWRNRDSEFLDEELSREDLLRNWEAGWQVLFDTLSNLKEEDLGREITIRQKALRAHDALVRSVSHAAYHVGQITLIAKGFAGENWQSLSIPKGQSQHYNSNPDLEKGPKEP